MPNKHACTVDIFRYFILGKNCNLEKRREKIQITCYMHD